MALDKREFGVRSSEFGVRSSEYALRARFANGVFATRKATQRSYDFFNERMGNSDIGKSEYY